MKCVNDATRKFDRPIDTTSGNEIDLFDYRSKEIFFLFFPPPRFEKPCRSSRRIADEETSKENVRSRSKFFFFFFFHSISRTFLLIEVTFFFNITYYIFAIYEQNIRIYGRSAVAFISLYVCKLNSIGGSARVPPIL